MNEQPKKLLVETDFVGPFAGLVALLMKFKLVGVRVRTTLIPADADELARSKLILPGDPSPWTRRLN